MNNPDIFYRALTEYKKQFLKDRDCNQLRKIIIASNPDMDKISSEINSCKVEDDWIIAIEDGLVYIEKAIAENRQHILTNGEVVPIEKVKRVSKDSVKHLAKHSELIKKETKELNVLPEKIYIVERLSDFAVYENRFLYMLLNYLKDFITLKYNKIVELTNSYKCGVNMNKAVVMNKRKLKFNLSLTDEKQDDEFLKQNNSLKFTLQRIENLLKTVVHFLATPLMLEVSKAPMLKPPITKINVLKMNQNFKGATNLYDFIMAYDKPGYIVEKKEKNISPFKEDTAEEFADLVMLTCFLAYENGLDLKQHLKKAYLEEEERRKNEEAEEKRKQLEQLKNKIIQSGLDPLEYMLMLEEHNKSLEFDRIQLASIKEENKKIKQELIEQKNIIDSLYLEIEGKISELAFITQKLNDEITQLKENHAKEVVELNERFISEKAEMIKAHGDEINSLKNEHEQILFELEEKHRLEDELKSNRILELENQVALEQEKFKIKLEETENEFNEKINSIEATYTATVSELEELNSNNQLENERLKQEKIYSDSRVLALRKEYNLITEEEDFTQKTSFDELEHQFKVFKMFFKEEWKKTKKSIRSGINAKKQVCEENVNKTE